MFPPAPSPSYERDGLGDEQIEARDDGPVMQAAVGGVEHQLGGCSPQQDHDRWHGGRAVMRLCLCVPTRAFVCTKVAMF